MHNLMTASTTVPLAGAHNYYNNILTVLLEYIDILFSNIYV